MAYDLTDAEKRDLIALIQQGKALPEKYRFLVFKDKREVDKPFRAFEVLNLVRYERQAYLGVECGSLLPLSSGGDKSGGKPPHSRREEALADKEREFRELIASSVSP